MHSKGERLSPHKVASEIQDHEGWVARQNPRHKRRKRLRERGNHVVESPGSDSHSRQAGASTHTLAKVTFGIARAIATPQTTHTMWFHSPIIFSINYHFSLVLGQLNFVLIMLQASSFVHLPEAHHQFQGAPVPTYVKIAVPKKNKFILFLRSNYNHNHSNETKKIEDCSGKGASFPSSSHPTCRAWATAQEQHHGSLRAPIAGGSPGICHGRCCGAGSPNF